MERLRSQPEVSPAAKPLRIAFLASHNGTDMRAIIGAIAAGTLNAEVAIVISNNPVAPALDFARQHGAPTSHISQTTVGPEGNVDRAIAEELEKNGADIVVLCGYMKKIGPETLKAFEGRILNVHPALLPDLKGHWGDAIHKEVLRRRRDNPDNPEFAWTGATIHIVDEEYDHGEHILQERVAVCADETPEGLKARIQALEITMWMDVLQDIIAGRLILGKERAPLRR